MTTPTPSLPSMTELLDLEELDRNLYRGVNEIPDNGKPTLFGGQVAAQALKAAGLTVPAERSPHSLHGYFLRPGWRNHPVIFNVERDRDGRSFSARRVSAVQNGEVIFDMTASFHVAERGGLYTPAIVDALPPPETCRREVFNDNFPLAEARMVPPTQADSFGNQVSPTIWLRISEELGEDPLNHCCAITYLSDIGSGFAALDVPDLPTGGPSLDHAMWFREPLRADRWVLLHMWPLMAGGARGLYAGSIHQQDGTLGAMITQESLLRPPA
jgi:acyl-CoA thioesterase II